jgi:hypothetical protein
MKRKLKQSPRAKRKPVKPPKLDPNQKLKDEKGALEKAIVDLQCERSLLQTEYDTFKEEYEHACKIHETLLSERIHLDQTLNEVRTQTAKLLDAYRPKSGKITIPAGTFHFASTHKIRTTGFFLLDEIAATIAMFRETEKGRLVFVMNEKLMLSSFGTLQSPMRYADTDFLVSGAVADNHVVVICQHYSL